MSSIFLLIFPTLMAFCAAYDFLTMRIPNWISLALIGAFFVIAFYIGMPLAQIGMHILVFVIVLIVGFLLNIPGWIGGGDAKFAASTSLWMGMIVGVQYLIVIAWFGGILTLAFLLFRWRIKEYWLPDWAWLRRLHDPKTGIPYGLALAAGGLFVYAEMEVFQKLLMM